VLTPILGVDAFTTTPFAGNPAAVCLLDSPADERWMQSLAAEMNLSETAYVSPNGGDFDLRWFTPTTEVELCGHATLASAHALWETGRLQDSEPARFRTRWKGELVAAREAASIALELPAAPSTPVDEPRGLSAALGAPLVGVARNDLHHLVELEDAAAVRALEPDFRALREVDIEAVAVTAASDDAAYDFVSRYFAPRHGIDEDPVTGSAHCSLGPWWSAHLARTEVVGYQVSRRGGVVRVRVEQGSPRVTLIGDAVTVWSGELAS
jgi:predicted PhzF superfamily epimerase YddE/YHI9